MNIIFSFGKILSTDFSRESTNNDDSTLEGRSDGRKGNKIFWLSLSFENGNEKPEKVSDLQYLCSDFSCDRLCSVDLRDTLQLKHTKTCTLV